MFDAVAIYYRQNFVLLVHNKIMNRQLVYNNYLPSKHTLTYNLNKENKLALFDVVAIYYRQNFVLLVHNKIMNRQFYEHKTATIINYNYNHFFCQTYKHLKDLTLLVFNVKILIKKQHYAVFYLVFIQDIIQTFYYYQN